jgi:hypothetical protein
MNTDNPFEANFCAYAGNPKDFSAANPWAMITMDGFFMPVGKYRSPLQRMLWLVKSEGRIEKEG